MAEISTIARPYAEAVFRVAQAGELNQWSQDLDRMAAIAGHPDMQDVFRNPKLSQDQVFEVFSGVHGTELGPQAKNFVRELIENGRMLALPEIAAQFHTLKNAREGSADAIITSAFPLSEAQLAELVDALEHKFKIKLLPSVQVDDHLIGGVQVVVGDQVLDTSVRTRLEQMRAALTA